MPLDEYQAKRQFNVTPEPQGGQGSGPLRFVVQKHAASHLHYDFRLEMGGILKSWAVPKGPSLNPDDKRLAMMTEDHPYDYRTFEGIIPAGNYGAGTVMVWDEGVFEPLGATGDRETDDKLARQGVHAGHLTFILRGQKLRGEFALIKMHGDQAEENAWLLVKAAKDEWAGDTDVTKLDRSAVTGRTLDEIAAGAPNAGGNADNTAAAPAVWARPPELQAAPKAPLPSEIQPMLATLADAPFDNPDWLYEIKWDGYRAIATLTPQGADLRSRRWQDLAAAYPPVMAALEAIKGATAVLDGEIVVLDPEGRSSFERLQTYADTGGELVYYVFDLLYLDGHDLTDLPLATRKAILRDWLPPSPIVRFSDHVAGRGVEFFQLAAVRGLEGVMAKDSRSHYQAGRRSRSWLKLKTHGRQEAVIGGYTAPRGSRTGFGALVLGVYDADGRLQYIGHTGGGFDDRALADVYARLQPLRRATSPFAGDFKVNAPVTWLEPQLVCEIEFREWTVSGHLRQPIFLGMRTDKDPGTVRRENPAPAPNVPTPNTPPAPPKFTPAKPTAPAPTAPASSTSSRAPIRNPAKVYWPDTGFTKGQLAEYYAAVADTILPYLRDRPESLHRYPGGIAAEGFYQKNFDNPPDWLPTVTVHSDSEDRDLQYILCNDRDALIYLINLGCIDLNPWNSRTESLDRPDWSVIDLDPEAVDFEAVITVAQCVHEVLERAHIPSYPKTSGATGIHIYIPLGAQYNYDQARDFAHIIGQMVNARLPELTSLERSPEKRQGRVYLDYLQNRRGQTLAAPYSVRPRPGTPVSTPLHWDEVVSGLHPSQFTTLTTPDRLRAVGDLWAPVLGPGVDLRAGLEALS